MEGPLTLETRLESRRPIFYNFVTLYLFSFRFTKYITHNQFMHLNIRAGPNLSFSFLKFILIRKIETILYFLKYATKPRTEVPTQNETQYRGTHTERNPVQRYPHTERNLFKEFILEFKIPCGRIFFIYQII